MSRMIGARKFKTAAILLISAAFTGLPITTCFAEQQEDGPPQYESYFGDLLNEFDSEIDAMAFAIFEKYNINDFQGTLFKRKNKPNPIFISEMKNLLKHFIWNWEEYLQKNKLQF